MDNQTFEQVVEMFEKIQTYKITNAKVVEIVKSMKDQFDRKKSLSEKQVELLKKFYTQNSPAAVESRNKWESEWNDEKKQTFKRIIQYYKMNPPYYGILVKAYEQNPDIIPAQSVYEKMLNNKFVQSFITKTDAAPIHNIGDMVKLTAAGQRQVYKFTVNEPALAIVNIMSVDVGPKGWVYTVRNLGGKVYEVSEAGISVRKIKFD
jgi:hypothetical protein